MYVSENSGTPKSSILIGPSIIFTILFLGTLIFGNTHINFLVICRNSEPSNLYHANSWSPTYGKPKLGRLTLQLDVVTNMDSVGFCGFW